MDKRLHDYIRMKEPSLNEAKWSTEAVTQSGEELFEDPKYKEIYTDVMLDTLLYYPVNVNTDIFPFEIRIQDSLIALGYLDERKQNILYLENKNKVITSQI